MINLRKLFAPKPEYRGDTVTVTSDGRGVVLDVRRLLAKAHVRAVIERVAKMRVGRKHERQS